ncbi:alpha/beta fold hydrolase [Mycobacterium sp. LTG2003]
MSRLRHTGVATSQASGGAPWIKALAAIATTIAFLMAVCAGVARRLSAGRSRASRGSSTAGSSVPLRIPPERPIEHRSVPAHFEATARSRRDQVALRTATDTITYGELLAACNAQTAAAPAGTPPQAALVTADLAAPTVSRILGLFASKIAVVAVDPATPDNRVEKIAAILAEHGYNVSTGDEPTDGTGDSVPAAVAGSDDGPGLDDITSIQFTSGSTGTPKAVLHTNGIWLADAQLLNDRFGLADGRKVALCMPISFAGGLNVLIGCLVGGAEIVGVDPREHSAAEAFARIRDSGAEVITCTPSFVDALHTAARGATLPNIHRIVTTGEPTHVRHIKLARELTPNAVFTNWAGSTETLAIASYDIAPNAPIPHGVVPVGIPAPHKKIHIDDNGAVSITSRYLGPGYLDAVATAATFFYNADGTTTYVGGDVGRWDAQDNLVLSGRAGSTVKIRGYLVEPSEIEATLSSYDDIREVVVVTESTEMPTLTAYVAPSATTRTPAVADLRTRLHRDLPPWMVPANIVILPALPRGDRGKVDRSALPKPVRPPFDPPRGEREAAVARLWADVLGVEAVSRTDSFYALGGDSLSVIRMLAILRESQGIWLKPADLAMAPTVAAFAEQLSDDHIAGIPQGRRPLNPTTVPLRPISDHTVGPVLFCFTGAGALSLCFVPLAERVGTETAVYAFEPSGLNRGALPDWSIRRAVQRHLADLRRIQPHGPYTLVGHSLGAHIALEAARRLESEGEKVELVAMLDPWLSPRVARDARKDLPGATVTLQTDDANTFGTWWERQKQVPLAGLFFGGHRRRTLATEEVGMITGYRHRPAPWAGRSLLIRSHLNRDDPRLWERILVGDTDFHVVECDHHSIVREPHIGVVVDAITAALNEVYRP